MIAHLNCDEDDMTMWLTWGKGEGGCCAGLGFGFAKDCLKGWRGALCLIVENMGRLLTAG